MEIPDAIAKCLGDSPEAVARRMLEQFALDEYNARRFGHGMVGLLLGFDSWHETEKFLRDNHSPLPYDVEDFEKDLKTYREVFGNDKAGCR